MMTRSPFSSRTRRAASPPSRAVWTLEGAGFKALTQADL